MKFQPDRTTAPTINGYGEGWLSVGTEKFHHSIIVGSDGFQQKWDCSKFDDLSAEHFAPLALLNAELIIFGSGAKTRFAPPQWLQPLINQKIGVESMDTLAACRTYNVLATEGRRVVAALLIEK